MEVLPDLPPPPCVQKIRIGAGVKVKVSRPVCQAGGVTLFSCRLSCMALARSSSSCWLLTTRGSWYNISVLYSSLAGGVHDLVLCTMYNILADCYHIKVLCTIHISRLIHTLGSSATVFLGPPSPLVKSRPSFLEGRKVQGYCTVV